MGQPFREPINSIQEIGRVGPSENRDKYPWTSFRSELSPRVTDYLHLTYSKQPPTVADRAEWSDGAESSVHVPI